MKRSEAIAAVEAAVKAAQEAGVSFAELQEAVGWGAFQGGSVDVMDRIQEQLDEAEEHECPDPCPDESEHDKLEELQENRRALKEALEDLVEGVEEALGDLKKKVEAMEDPAE